jgi:hypothetical protein
VDSPNEMSFSRNRGGSALGDHGMIPEPGGVEFGAGARRLSMAGAIERVPMPDPILEEALFRETISSDLVPTPSLLSAPYYDLPLDQRRTYLWASQILRAARVHGRQWRVPGLVRFAAGFFDPDQEGPGFGLIVHAAAGRRLPSIKLPSIQVGDYSFPVVLRQPTRRLHAPTVQPINGTSSCWAVSRASGQLTRPIGPALLTAKHVTPATIGARVPLTDGSSGTVVDIAPEGIDAALIESFETPGSHQVPVRPLVAPWMDVNYHGAATARTIVTKVSSITDTLGVYSSSSLPARVFLADGGQQGDSGALVRDHDSGDAVGIYMGELTDPRNRTEGFAQHAYQAQILMELELYE